VKEIYDFGSAISADFDKNANNNHIFTFYSFHSIFANNGIRKSEKLKELFFANARQKLKEKLKN
jgi:hypothetical protein